MQGTALPIGTSEFSNLNNVAGWFIRLRWIAAFGVLLALLIAHFVFPGLLPEPILFAANGILLASNTIYHHHFSIVKRKNLSKKELTIFLNLQICMDYVLLLILVFFTGFLENPFVYFFIFHIMLTAYFFTPNRVYLYTGSLVATIFLLATAEYTGLIPHFPIFSVALAGYRQTIFIRAAGVTLTLMISAYLGTSIKQRLDERRLQVEIELNRYMSMDKLKSGFILQVTHELRGPLAAVNGFHEMIARGLTGPVSEKTLLTLAKATRRNEALLTMIGEMIDYAYMQTEDQKLVMSAIPLREVIDHSIEALTFQAQTRNIHFDVKCDQQLTVRATRDLVAIIAGNLFSNAIKYSPAGSTIFITVVPEYDEVCLEVRDQGIGMSEAELSRIFEEFYRTRQARELERDGTGLGLSIIKKAVETLDGRITVASEVDRGTIFHIFFKGR